MPTTVNAIADKLGLAVQGPVRWGERIPCTTGGIYVICAPSAVATPLFDLAAISDWIAKAPRLSLAGLNHADVTSQHICGELEKFWLADEVILYVGKAGRLRNRIYQYYRTPLGARRPHRGGCWLKALANLRSFDIYWVESEDSGMLEKQVLECFATEAGRAGGMVPGVTRAPILPFANLEVPGGMRKRHAIMHAC